MISYFIFGDKFGTGLSELDGPYASIPAASSAMNLWASLGGSACLITYDDTLPPAYPFSRPTQNTNVTFTPASEYMAVAFLPPATKAGTYLVDYAAAVTYYTANAPSLPLIMWWKAADRVWYLVPWPALATSPPVGFVLSALASASL